MIFVRKLVLCIAVLFCAPAISLAAAERTEPSFMRTVAEIDREPLIFFKAKGGPNACGAGCSEWIAVEGGIDSFASLRFRKFLSEPKRYDLPIFFNSRGGSIDEAMQIGAILRANRMIAGIARTVPEGCRPVIPIGDTCRRLMQSKREHTAQLIIDLSRCASACVWAMVGASERHVPTGAALLVHASLGPSKVVERGHDLLLRYVVGMGVDSGMVDAAHSVPAYRIRALGRREIERFGFESRGSYETRWLIYRKPPERFLLLKSVTTPLQPNHEFVTRALRLGCAPSGPTIRLAYRRELVASESIVAPAVQIDVEGARINTGTLSLTKDSVEKYVDIDFEHLQSVVTAGSIDFYEAFDPAAAAVSSRVAKFSTLGLSIGNLAELRSECASRTP